MTIANIPNVPVPAGATTDNCWSEPDCDGDMMRSLVWSRYDTDKIGVAVDGWQDATGKVVRCVSLYDTEGKELTAGDARQLAAALLDAAEALDRIAGTAPPF